MQPTTHHNVTIISDLHDRTTQSTYKLLIFRSRPTGLYVVKEWQQQQPSYCFYPHIRQESCPTSSSVKWKAALQLHINLNAFCMGRNMV